MDKKEILALLSKYRQGKCDDEEIRKIHLWYESINHDSEFSLTAHEKQLLENKLLKNIRREINNSEPEIIEIQENRSWWRTSFVYSGIAASLIIGIFYLLFFNNQKRNEKALAGSLISVSPTSKLVIKKNETSESKQIRLSDNSLVTMSPGSEITYPEEFEGGKREVQLKGNAFFQVTKNESKPFLVYSGKLITKVLGTSFWIKTNEKDMALEVEVITGKVSVFENNMVIESDPEAAHTDKSNNGVLLTPNQRVTYFSESGHLLTSIVAKPVVIEDRKVSARLNFNNTPLPEIIAILHQEYGIEIVFANDRLEKCTFTGDVSDMSLYEKLDLICKSNSADYEVKGTRILISGEGCEI